MNKKYYWLKLKNDFFKRHDIKIIEDRSVIIPEVMSKKKWNKLRQPK